MNLTEYRNELCHAHTEFRDTIEKAAAVLHERVTAADDAFLGVDDEPRAAEPGSYRHRD